MNRRGVLKRLMMAPLAAKSAAEEVARQVGGIYPGLGAPALHTGLASSAGDVVSVPSSGSSVRTVPYQVVQNLARGMFRQQVEDVLRLEARNFSQLDPDLAFAKKSWSMAAKIHEQRRRNLERLMADVGRPDYWTRRNDMLKLLGL